MCRVRCCEYLARFAAYVCVCVCVFVCTHSCLSGNVCTTKVDRNHREQASTINLINPMPTREAVSGEKDEIGKADGREEGMQGQHAGWGRQHQSYESCTSKLQSTFKIDLYLLTELVRAKVDGVAESLLQYHRRKSFVAALRGRTSGGNGRGTNKKNNSHTIRNNTMTCIFRRGMSLVKLQQRGAGEKKKHRSLARVHLEKTVLPVYSAARRPYRHSCRGTPQYLDALKTQ